MSFKVEKDKRLSAEVSTSRIVFLTIGVGAMPAHTLTSFLSLSPITGPTNSVPKISDHILVSPG